MSKVVLFVFIVVMVWVISLTTVATSGKYYDCTLAEMHPDYPLKVKEACRELRRRE